MPNEIGLFEAIRTQRAIRYFKPDPVPDDALDAILEAASKAPSGTNRQMWHFVIVRDPDLRANLADIYRRAGNNALPNLQWLQDANPRILRSATHLIDHMDDAPVLLLACIEHAGAANLTTGSSIYPAVQNILLAARGLGLGSVLTTFHKQYESEVKALLGIPDNVETAALLPIGYPADGVRYGPTRRKPMDEVTHWDGWRKPQAHKQSCSR